MAHTIGKKEIFKKYSRREFKYYINCMHNCIDYGFMFILCCCVCLHLIFACILDFSWNYQTISNYNKKEDHDDHLALGIEN